MRFLSIPALLAVGLLAGCSFSPITNLVHPYRVDVRQGNYVDQAMISQLKKGMSREQVRFVLGTPLVVDPFRRDRWDYVYRLTKGWGEPQERKFSVFFDGERLDHVEGDVLAGDAQKAADEQREASRVVEITAPPAKD